MHKSGILRVIFMYLLALPVYFVYMMFGYDPNVLLAVFFYA